MKLPLVDLLVCASRLGFLQIVNFLVVYVVMALCLQLVILHLLCDGGLYYSTLFGCLEFISIIEKYIYIYVNFFSKQKHKDINLTTTIRYLQLQFFLQELLIAKLLNTRVYKILQDNPFSLYKYVLDKNKYYSDIKMNIRIDTKHESSKVNGAKILNLNPLK